MTNSDMIAQLQQATDALNFSNTMDIIDALYDFTPTKFTNGGLHNEADQNNGSCKLFSFAQLHHFTELQALACFGEYYRGVLDTPDGDDHQNIRHFMKTGWAEIAFDGVALTSKEQASS